MIKDASTVENANQEETRQQPSPATRPLPTKEEVVRQIGLDSKLLPEEFIDQSVVPFGGE